MQGLFKTAHAIWGEVIAGGTLQRVGVGGRLAAGLAPGGIAVRRLCDE